MDVSAAHKTVKQPTYWTDLVSGTNGQYKDLKIDELLAKYYAGSGAHLMDVGCGTCDLILRYKAKFDSSVVTCSDYDEKIISQMREKFSYPGLEWIVADVFDLSSLKHKYDLVFLLDMLHEIYSFYGRKSRVLDCPVDHDLGSESVKTAIANLAKIMNPKGGIVITDNVLTEDDSTIEVFLKSDEVASSVSRFFAEYPSKKIEHKFLRSNVVALSQRDFCILTTQYNKIKQGNFARWNVEKMEIHQYMTVNEYRTLFDSLGFDVHMTIGTPPEARSEYERDFEVLTEGFAIPEKRITLLAIKR